MPPAPIPDRPRAFGYKQIWLAVKDREPAEVAQSLGLDRCRPANWEQGIDRAYESPHDMQRAWFHRRVEMFVAPPVMGWTLAVGGIGALPTIESGKGIPWLEGLSKRLGHVQFYGTHRVSNYAARAEGGQLVRAFAYADGRLTESGPMTAEEIELGFDFLDRSRATPEKIAAHDAKCEAEFLRMAAVHEESERRQAEGADLDNEPQFHPRLAILIPDEDSVMQIAGRWSLDPTRLDEIEAEPGLGLLGLIRRR